MASISIVGKCFTTAEAFMAYLETIQFTKAWRPSFITLHHTGGPTLKQWENWQGRVSDEQWMKNLASYYGNPAYDDKGKMIKGAWTAGPHFFITPRHYCVLSHPDKKGVHAQSFNGTSWAVEAVGNFDIEPFDGVIKQRVIEGLACLHVAAGFSPEFVKGRAGLHFHRDDPLTSKTCPGRKVERSTLIEEIKVRMALLTVGDHPDEAIEEDTTKELPPPYQTKQGDRPPEGVVRSPDGTLNLREAASTKSPLILTLRNDQKVAIVGEAMNGETKWFKVWLRLDGLAKSGWVSAKYIARAGG